MKKYIIWLILSVFTLIGYSCGGGGGGSYVPTSISIIKDNVSGLVVSKSNPKNITFLWSVNHSPSQGSYYMNIYISKNNTLSTNDIPIAVKVSNASADNITIKPSSLGYQYLLSLYGGIYYIIFDAYTKLGTVSKVSIMFL